MQIGDVVYYEPENAYFSITNKEKDDGTPQFTWIQNLTSDSWCEIQMSIDNYSLRHGKLVKICSVDETGRTII